MSVPEIRHLLARLVLTRRPLDPDHVIAHSRWRRRHQAAAQRAHYRARRR